MSMKLSDHLGHVLAHHAEQDDRIWVLDGDLADSDGAIHFAQRHPDRFLMTGIAEQNMVSVAAGMADCGKRPWVFSFAAFLCYRAYDQIRIGLGQSSQPVVLVASHAGGLAARNGKTHAAPNDLALMLTMPGVQVWTPGDSADVALAVRSCLDNNGPSYIRMPRRQFAESDVLPGVAAPLRWLRPRRPITLLSAGLASHWALEAAALLEQQGIDVGILHCASLQSPERMAHELQGVSQLAVIEDHVRFGGLASLAAQLALPARIHAFGWPVDYAGKSGSDDELRAHYGLSGAALADVLAPLHHRPS